MMCLIRHLLIIVFALPLSATCQEDEYIFKNFTQEEGLPSNETYCVFEDSRHFLWIGTDHGVVRYDGNKFETFQLPDNVVFLIKEDKDGKIWFFTQKAQLSYFENEKIYPFVHNAQIENRIKRILIIQAYFDRDNNFILNTALDSNYHISRLGQITSFPAFTLQPTPTHFKLLRADDGSIQCQRLYASPTTRNEVKIELKDGTDNRLYDIPLKHISLTHFGSLPGSNGDVFFYCGKYLVKLRRDGTFVKQELPDEIVSLNRVRGKLLAGVMRTGGIMLTDNLNILKDEIILPGKTVTSVSNDYEGGTWFSTLESGVFLIKNTNVRKFTNSVAKDELVFRMLNVGDSQLIFASPTGLFSLKNGTITTLMSRQSTSIADIQIDELNNIYFFGSILADYGKTRDNVYPFKAAYLVNTPGEAILFPDKVMITASTCIHLSKKKYTESYFSVECDTLIAKPGKLFKAKNGLVWLGTNDGLYFTNKELDSFIQYQPHVAFLNKGISCIRQMENGNLVAGIRFGGITILNDTGILLNITESDGLLSNKIKYIHCVNNSIWVATAKGISIVTFKNNDTYVIKNVGKNEGFYNITINQLTPYRGSMAAATSKGIYFIDDPNNFVARQYPTIPFFIKQVKYYAGDTIGVQQISLPYGKAGIVIKYAAISYNSPDLVEYWYRLSGRDTNWSITTSTELPLENFEPGSYTLELKAFIPNQNRNSEIVRFTIIVAKAWWQNNFLRFCLLLLIAGIVYLLVRYQLEKIKRKEQQKTEFNAQLAELEQTALRSQMNSHFVFNCLTSIQQLIVSGNKAEANEFLVRFARLIRKTLEISSKQVITVREELEYLTEYLLVEQTRMINQFQFELIAAPELLNYMIPNMMLQPAVENCIRHGIKSLAGKGQITVTLAQKENILECTIDDNGVGRTASANSNKSAFSNHKSFGMDIIQKRLNALHTLTGRNGPGIKFTDLVNQDGTAAGTRVTIYLPIME